MKREKFILRPGKICTLDISNLSHSDDNGVFLVEIIKKSYKRRLFGQNWYTIIGAGGDEFKLTRPIDVPEDLLSPSGMVVIRYPSDFPIINELDIDALDTAIKLIEFPTTMNTTKDRKINRLKALREKLKLSMLEREV